MQGQKVCSSWFFLEPSPIGKPSVVEKQAEEMLEVYEEQFKQPFFGLDRFF